jgi:hypothetical protein
MKKSSAKKVISSDLGKVKPELPQSVKIMMNQKMEEPISKSVKLSVKKKK